MVLCADHAAHDQKRQEVTARVDGKQLKWLLSPDDGGNMRRSNKTQPDAKPDKHPIGDCNNAKMGFEHVKKKSDHKSHEKAPYKGHAIHLAVLLLYSREFMPH